MINDYKKGDLIVLTYTVDSEKFCSSGIVLSVSDSTLTIGHNFSHFSPIDTTSIPIKDVLKNKKVIPKEINSLDDVSLMR